LNPRALFAGFPGALLALALFVAAPSPAWSANDEAMAQAAQLASRLDVLDADPALGGLAQLERFKARTALTALANAKSRDRDHLAYIATARVAAAEQAAQAESLLAQSAQLDRERDQIMVEASKRQAEAAQREADRLRREAMAREEEQQRANEQAAVERATLEQQSQQAGAAAEQAMKLADARAEETRLARKEAELAAALAGDGASGASGTSAAPPPKRAVAKGTLYTLPGSAFASGSSALSPSAVASLRALFKSIGAKKTLRVEAHTDDQGPDAANLALSQKRADAVKKALVDAGIGGSRITAVGRGEAAPVADNATADGRARNRRVEITVQ
jgi:outer membrane protein OmpA-like peptidoglycan-associated protein